MKKILFIDTLTTGMNHERCAIYRIGGIFVQNDEETERLDLKVRPFHGAKINDQSLWIGGVDRSQVAAYPNQDSAFKEFITFLDKHVDAKNPNDKIYLAGFNASGFDYPFLWEWFRRNGNEKFRNYFHMQVLDIMCISAFALLDERGSMPDFRLETVARHLGVYDGEGDSADCVLNARIALEIYAEIRTRLSLDPQIQYKRTQYIFQNWE